MKERYNIEISDIQLSIISDEPEEFVNNVVAQINERVNELIVHNKRCSKLDAALLCALDYCSENAKAEKKIRNLEEQIALYDARIKRMRQEVADSAFPTDVKKSLGVSEDGAGEAEKESDEIVKSDVEELEMLDAASNDLAEISEALDSLVDDVKKSEEPKKSKLEQIEMLLRQNS